MASPPPRRFATREPAPGQWVAPRPGTAQWNLPAEEMAMELRMRVLAFPLAIAVAWLVAHTGMPHALMRIFLSMWIDESGHAVTAWLCSLPAFPGPWFTPVAQERSWILALAAWPRFSPSAPSEPGGASIASPPDCVGFCSSRKGSGRWRSACAGRRNG